MAGLGQAAVDALQHGPDVVLEQGRFLGSQPQVVAHPGRVRKVPQRHDGLHPGVVDEPDDLGVAVERPLVDRGRGGPGRQRLRRARRLDARPLDPEPECVQAQRRRLLDVRPRVVPEAVGLAGPLGVPRSPPTPPSGCAARRARCTRPPSGTPTCTRRTGTRRGAGTRWGRGRSGTGVAAWAGRSGRLRRAGAALYPARRGRGGLQKIGVLGRVRERVPAGHLGVPPAPVLDRPLLRLVVDGDEPEARLAAVDPLPVVREAPVEVAADVDALLGPPGRPASGRRGGTRSGRPRRGSRSRSR